MWRWRGGCSTCGCSSGPGGVRLTVPGAPQHFHPHDHDHDRGHTIALEQAVLARNDSLAEDNRRWLAERGLVAVNLMSSPGAGKTTLLERTIVELAGELVIS